MIYLGVDTGGTFTDFVLITGAGLTVHKVLSTPDAPERAILQGIKELNIEQDELLLVHGSTVATNAALEGKGVKTLYICNAGFEDVLSIGRQNRQRLYDLQATPIAPPVPAELCLGVGGRLSATGELLSPLTEDDFKHIVDAIEQHQPQAVAVNLLFSWLRPELEQSIKQVLPEELFVALSSEVLPEIREYERGIATWLNAWVGPVVSQYLKRLQQALPNANSISVMQSSGTTIAASKAGHEAVRMLLSGPAGGLSGARFMAAYQGIDKMLTFDMGGTSADVALLDGKPTLTTSGRIGRYPVAVPMVDIHTIGAGGGSQAYLDAAGMLHVGPESAGAMPGPACYGNGGEIPTVTDANLVLGRLVADQFLGGQMTLDAEAATAAVGVLADNMGCSLQQAAQGIIDLANEHMVRALRVISVERGYDPAKFTLVSFGGAGGLHACALADALSCSKVLIPAFSGVLSALGMLATPAGRFLSRTRLGILKDMQANDIQADFDAMIADGLAQLKAENQQADDIESSCYLDVRYLGQSTTLSIAWSTIQQVIVEFHAQHRARFGHQMATDVELVNLRVEVVGQAKDIALRKGESPENQAEAQYTPVMGEDKPVQVISLTAIEAGLNLPGPLIITELSSTSWVPTGWQVAKDDWDNLLLNRT